jgi:O-antigen/teichoic acid export membrane protein
MCFESEYSDTPLARLLAPEAFGLVGMAIVFIAFLQVMGEMGMTAALWLPHCYE